MSSHCNSGEKKRAARCLKHIAMHKGRKNCHFLQCSVKTEIPSPRLRSAMIAGNDG
jgi:hypothetical protein